ncbi:MAG TPA: DNA/RNA non-specific endonuclease [Actinocatenispora sp.]
MPAYQQLMTAKPADFAGVGRALESAGGKLTKSGEAFTKSTQKAGNRWLGEASGAHTARATTIDGGITTVVGIVEASGGVATGGGEAFVAFTGALREFVAGIEAAQFIVTPAGVVTISPEQEAEADAAGPAAPAALAAFEAAALGLTAAIETAVGAATALDTALAEAIVSLSSALADATGVLAPRPPGMMDGTFPSTMPPGGYKLGDLKEFADGSSRGTSLDAYIHPDQLQGAQRPAIPSDINPAGYLGGLGPHAKSHLLADTLGGPINDPKNYVTLYSKDFSHVNDGPMRSLEQRIRSVVEGRTNGVPQQNVRYRVEALGDEKLPDSVRIIAEGDRGYRESLVLPNL